MSLLDGGPTSSATAILGSDNCLPCAYKGSLQAQFQVRGCWNAIRAEGSSHQHDMR